MINIRELLEEIKASPYEEVAVTAPHTGVVEFAEPPEDGMVHGRGGSFKEKPGTLLAHLTRERNRKPVCAPLKGRLVHVAREFEGRFVEAGVTLARIRHYLTKEEVLERILQKSLSLFCAPEKAKYYFIPEVDLKIKASGEKSVKVSTGQELFIVSRMKRETPLAYDGPGGIIYSIYFHQGGSVDIGDPLIGVCPEDRLSQVQEVVARVQSEWEEVETT